MSSGVDIIIDAYRRIGVTSSQTEVESESIVSAVPILNSMIEMWRTNWDIELTTINPLKVAGDPFDEPIDTRNGIVDNLAILLAPNFNKPISPDLRLNAKNGFEDIRDSYSDTEVPIMQFSSTTPRGAGNTRGIKPRVYMPIRTARDRQGEDD